MTAPAHPAPDAEPGERAVFLLQRMRELLLECRGVMTELHHGPVQESEAAAAERIAYGVLVAALEEGLVTTLERALDVLKRFSAPAGPHGEQWLREQESKLRGSDGPTDLPR